MTAVKNFHSALTGAPTLSGTAGSLIAVLDACLVDGFGLKTADSVTVSGGKATINISSGHPYEADLIVLVAGATPAGLNGLKRIESTTTTAATFDATGIADGAATGTITVKIAPAGWQKVYSGTNIAVYRSQDVTGTRMYLRVDDTGTTNARVVGYESMTDANTGSGMFPTALQVSGGGYWPKAGSSGAAARAWTVIADSRSFWLHMHTNTTFLGINGSVWGFGDFASYKSGDAYACTLWCAQSDISTGSSQSSYAAEYTPAQLLAGPFAPRPYTGLGGSVNIGHYTESYAVNGGVSGYTSQSSVPSYPNGPNNGMFFSRKVVGEIGLAIRGVCRGILTTPHVCHSLFNWRDKIQGQGDYVGRKLLAVKCGSPFSALSAGVVFFDITGPWA